MTQAIYTFGFIEFILQLTAFPQAFLWHTATGWLEIPAEMFHLN
jgi:hypothetical protein